MFPRRINNVHPHFSRPNLPNTTHHPPPPEPQTHRRRSLLVIPIRWPEPHTSDSDHKAPPQERRELLLQDLYKTYLEDHSQLSAHSLTWINLLRDILNNAPWTIFWAQLMNMAHATTVENPEQLSALRSLQNRNILMVPPPRLPSNRPYNWFPLPPPEPLNPYHINP